MSDESRTKYFPPRTHKYHLYPFYQTKDGDDCLWKTVTIASYTGAAGTGLAFVTAMHATTHQTPAFFSHIMIKMAKYALPMAAAGAMFSASICTIANLRGGANDPWNHLFGGLAAGSVFGAVAKSHGRGWAVGTFIGLGALIWKAGRMEGWANFEGVSTRRSKGFHVYKRSWFTTRPDPEGEQSLN